MPNGIKDAASSDEKLFEEYARRNSLDVLENANQYPGPTGFFAYLLEKEMEKHLTILPEKPLKAHLEGDIYIHKLPLALYIPYCSGHSVARMLEKGMLTPTVISRPARHFDTYVDHIANFLIIAQQHFTGAQAFSSVEWYAGPFIRKDNLDYKQIKQNVQRLVFNLNYPSRFGMQSPFTNFTVTLDAPKKMLEGDYAIYDGKKVAPLGEYEKEAKLFFLALTDILREGDAIGQPFTYPIPTIMASAPMLWNDPEIYDAVFSTAAKRGSFYWLNTNVVDPDASYAMCLFETERIVYRKDGKVSVKTIKEFFEEFASELEAEEEDGAEWYKVKDKVEVLATDINSKKVEWKPIKRFLRKKYNKAYRIVLVDGRQFIVSPDHPIPVKKENVRKVETIKAEELANRLSKGERLLVPILLTKTNGEEQEIKLEDGRVIKVDESFAYFMGLYYGDGTIVRNSYDAKRISDESKKREGSYFIGIQFSINSEEEDIKEFILSYTKNILKKEARVKIDPRWESVTYIRIYDALLARAFYDLGISGYSDEKRIPSVIWSAPAEVKRAFIKGLLHSDGYWRKNTWELHIKNKELALDVLLLSSMAGISAYFRENKDGSVVVYFPGSVGDEIGNPTKAIKHKTTSGDFAWVRVKYVEPLEVEGYFYDVEVEGVHYFVHSEGIITHNCCRINIDKNELKFAFSVKTQDDRIKEIEKQRFGGLWAMPDVTGSIQVTTINLPRLAIESKDEEDFWEKYAQKLYYIKEVEDWFRERYINLIRNYKDMYKFFHDYLWDFPSSHFNTIGIIGLPEAAAILMQDPDLWFEGSKKDWLEAAKLMKKMVQFAVKHAREWMKLDGTPWNVEEVPGESAAAKLALKDVKKYPEIIEYLSDPENPIYSTSIAPYYGSLELIDRIRIEEQVQSEFTGGVMMHIFLGEQPEKEALASLTKKILRTKIVYWSYTPAITVCNDCKHSFTGLYTKCPRCGSTNVEIWSRIIGYYRPLKNWNPFRKKEFWTRRHYQKEYVSEQRREQQFF